MAKISVRAICLFGKYDHSNSAWDDDYQGIFSDQVEEIFVKVESFLKKNGKPVKHGENPFPYLDDGIISGPNLGSIYSFNDNLLMNCFVSGNGFNFNGVYHTIISAGFSEEKIKETFEILKRAAGLYSSSWKENSNFKKDVKVPSELKGNLERLLEFKPKLLSVG